MLTHNEIEDKIRARLADGKGRATMTRVVRGHDGLFEAVCAYKTKDGNRCAVGCLIKPEHYTPKFEGISVTLFAVDSKFVLLRNALIRSGVPESAFLMLTAWQKRHDDPRNWDGRTYTGPLESAE